MLCTLLFTTSLALALQIVQAVLVRFVVWLLINIFLAGLAFLVWTKGERVGVLFLVMQMTFQFESLECCQTAIVPSTVIGLCLTRDFARTHPKLKESTFLGSIYFLVQGADGAGMDP